MDQSNLALLVLRVVFGVGLAYHGYNKVFRGGRLAGTARWFASIGMRWPALQARAAAGTEIGAGLLFALGLLTPFAAAGMIGVMAVAGWVAHRKNGFLIINEGWELRAQHRRRRLGGRHRRAGPLQPRPRRSASSSTAGPGRSIAALLGLGAAIAQLAVCYRPPATGS